MAIITRTIGTVGRDYSTIAAWEADLDNAAIYAAGDDAVGELYNDSTFNERVDINGGGTIGLNSIRITVPVAERHNGTASTGVRWEYSSGSDGTPMINLDGTIKTTVEWIVNNYHGRNAGGARYAFGNSFSGPSSSVRHLIQNCIGDPATKLTSAVYFYSSNRDNIIVQRNILYGYDRGINPHSGNSTDTDILNNTIYDCGAIGINTPASGDVKNNIVIDNTDDFVGTFPAGADYNMASDATAPGANSLQNKTAANLFVSTVAGSIDLHLKTGADAIDVGVDLGTTPTGVNIDIDGRDVDLEGDIWDIGADEYLAAGGVGFQSAWAMNSTLTQGMPGIANA